MKNKFLTIFLILFIFSFVSSECLEQQIDINSASQKELEKLNGIGPTYATRIIESRPFYSLDELTKVSGIGAATLQKIKDQNLACISGQITPSETTQSQNTIDLDKININTATAQELIKLEGIGTTYATRIIESRPFYSLDELVKVNGIGPSILEKIKQQGLAYIDEKDLPKEEPETQKIITLSKENQETENIINLNKQETPEQTITGSVIYQSKTEIIRKYSIYGFSIFLIVIIFLIIKK